MNWTGGNLSRHSKKTVSNGLINRQRHHFSRARSSLEHGYGIPPDVFQPDFLEGERSSIARQTRLEDYRNVAPVVAQLASLAPRLHNSRHTGKETFHQLPSLISGHHHAGDDASPRTLRDPPRHATPILSLPRTQDPIDVLRHKLLSKADWVGLHPVQSASPTLVETVPKGRKRRLGEVSTSPLDPEVMERTHVPSIREKRRRRLGGSTKSSGALLKDITILIGGDAASSRLQDSATREATLRQLSVGTVCAAFTDEDGRLAAALKSDESADNDEAKSRGLYFDSTSIQSSDLSSHLRDRRPRSIGLADAAALIIQGNEISCDTRLESRKEIGVRHLGATWGVSVQHANNPADEIRMSDDQSPKPFAAHAARKDPVTHSSHLHLAPSRCDSPIANAADADPDKAWEHFVFDSASSPTAQEPNLVLDRDSNCSKPKVFSSMQANVSEPASQKSDDSSLIGLADDESTLLGADRVSHGYSKRCNSHYSSAASSSPGRALGATDLCSNAATRATSNHRASASNTTGRPWMRRSIAQGKPYLTTSSSSDELSRPAPAPARHSFKNHASARARGQILFHPPARFVGLEELGKPTETSGGYQERLNRKERYPGDAVEDDIDGF